MKVAIIDPAAYTLPYDVALSSALADEGCDVTLFTTRFAHGPMPSADTFSIEEWFYRRSIPLVGRRAARAVQHPFDMRRLCRHLVRERFDVAHVQWSVINRIDIPAWGGLSIPTVLTVHDPVGRPGSGVDCSHLHSFDAVVVHSSYGEQRLRERCAPEAVWQVPHGAFDSFVSEPEPETALPLPHPDAGPVVALPGLLRPYKGVDTLLEAWGSVRERVPNATLVIAGRPMGVELPDPLPEGVLAFPRFLDDREFASIVRRADVIVLPYREIDLSGVLFGALALGKPMVLSDIGGFSEFGNGNGALLVPPDSPVALANALARTLDDATLRSRLSNEALRAARERYSWREIAATYVARYESIRGRVRQHAGTHSGA